MMLAIIKEIHLSAQYLPTKALESIYFGGGTPSLLTKKDLGQIFNALARHYTWSSETEITLEANPDDLNSQNIASLNSIGINRLSIGIQSFFNEDLVFMNRAHNAQEAEQCILLAKEVGLNNISIDLIYGSETTSHEMWQTNIEKALNLEVPHISSYCLTIEDQTALASFVKRGIAKPLDEEKAERQFHHLILSLKTHGFEHYEISNFAQEEKYAVHNSNYWLGKDYLGIGPSAHSFNGHSRRWNIANNAKYIKSIKEGAIPFTVEHLSPSEQYNEYILIRLRTKWGCSFEDIANQFPEFSEHFSVASESLMQSGLIEHNSFSNSIVLSEKGKFLADKISVDLMV